MFADMSEDRDARCKDDAALERTELSLDTLTEGVLGSGEAGVMRLESELWTWELYIPGAGTSAPFFSSLAHKFRECSLRALPIVAVNDLRRKPLLDVLDRLML